MYKIKLYTKEYKKLFAHLNIALKGNLIYKDLHSQQTAIPTLGKFGYVLGHSFFFTSY